jgi:hypothetical protein
MYISFHYGIKSEFNIDYSEDFMRFFFYLNEDADIIDLSGFGGRMRLYNEIALGLSMDMGGDLIVGGRLKFLSGKIDLEIKDQDIYVGPGEGGWTDSWIMNSRFDVVGSFPFIDLHKTGAEVDSFDFDTDFSASDITDMIGPKNLGFGIDIGAHYSPIENLTISASILDLGFIRWSKNNMILTQDSEYEFRGMEIVQWGDSIGELLTNMKDSIMESFKFTDNSAPYTSMLTSRVFIGARYYLTEKVNFGLLTRTEIYRKKLYPQITLSANVQPIRAVSASLSYSVLNREFYNIGLGLALKGGPISLYIISDTYPLAFTKGTPIPVYLKGFRFQFGFNLLFGCNKKKQMLNDVPLVE